jgi:hypothetical protein
VTSAVRFFSLLLGLATPALAQVVADRTTLNSILGASAVTADFEGFSIATGGAVDVSGVTQLDNGTLVNGQGPALVPAGVTFLFPGGGNLQWNDNGYYSAPSREILTNVNNAIEIQFTNATKAFGIDLRAFSGYTETITATVYGADKTTVLSTIPNLSPSSAGTALFFGYQSASGIGKVTFSQTPNNWSPIIDNLTFAPIPELPPHVLLGGGLVIVAMARRRTCRFEPPSR